MTKENTRILVTGAKGFIGRNLVAELKNRKFSQIYEFDTDNNPEDLDNFTSNCEIVFHLAGVNRPEKVEDFLKGNYDFSLMLINSLKKHNNNSPIIFTSSSQAKLNNEYGKSKLAAENTFKLYSEQTNVPVLVFRLANVFGKWCRPSYNSVVATFCHNIAHGMPIIINDTEAMLNLIYIDDVISEFAGIGENISSLSGYHLIENLAPLHNISLSNLSSLLSSFQKSRETKSLPDLSDHLTRKLYATYLSYLPENGFSYPLKMNIDQRGSFTEFIKTTDRGQVSVNISKPGIVKGNHWHHTKNEKFLVVNGTGIIRFRKTGTSEIIEYNVSGEKLEVLDIPPGYTHNIENVGLADMVTVMWASETFDPEKPDTYFEAV